MWLFLLFIFLSMNSCIFSESSEKNNKDNYFVKILY